MIARLLAATAALALALPAIAAEEDKPKTVAPAKEYQANRASKVLSGTFGGRAMRYTATVEEQVLKDEKGEAKAAIVTSAYVAEPRDPSRPVTFLLNGGPGSG
jgi:carboxypeptidase C (cathepsin A)